MARGIDGGPAALFFNFGEIGFALRGLVSLSRYFGWTAMGLDTAKLAVDSQVSDALFVGVGLAGKVAARGNTVLKAEYAAIPWGAELTWWLTLDVLSCNPPLQCNLPPRPRQLTK